MTEKIRRIISRISDKESDLLDLMNKIAQKDESAFDRLYRIAGPNVYGLAHRILKNKPDAEEISYDVFMQIWNSAGLYDSSKSSPLGWMLMITRTRCIDRIRKESKSKNMDDIELHDPQNPSDSPEKSVTLSEQQAIVKNAISKLNDNERKMIELAYYYGLTQSEISKFLNQPLGTVKTTIRRSLINLKEYLTKDN